MSGTRYCKHSDGGECLGCELARVYAERDAASSDADRLYQTLVEVIQDWKEGYYLREIPATHRRIKAAMEAHEELTKK